MMKIYYRPNEEDSFLSTQLLIKKCCLLEQEQIYYSKWCVLCSMDSGIEQGILLHYRLQGVVQTVSLELNPQPG